MRYLFLDTNVYLGCALLTQPHSDPDLVTQLRQAMNGNRVILLVPSAVRAEFLGKRSEVLAEIKQQMGNLKATVNQARLTSNRDRNKLLSTIDDLMVERGAAFEKATRDIEDLWKSSSCVMLEASGDTLARAVDRSIAHLPPADGKHIVDQDCLVLEQVAAGVPRDATSLIFCSENKTDFCAQDRERKEVLRPEILTCFTVPVSYCGTLPDLLKTLNVTPHPDTLQEYREAVRSLYKQDDTAQIPRRRVLELTVNKEFDPVLWMERFVTGLRESGIVPSVVRIRHRPDLAGVYGVFLVARGGDGGPIREIAVHAGGVLICRVLPPTRKTNWIWARRTNSEWEWSVKVKR
ncbi:MAG: PIN domain-containing protein [Bacillota bacterium]|nr:PIN domain-containing protein [Bacillota bacterium]